MENTMSKNNGKNGNGSPSNGVPSYGLQSQALSPLETIAQSVANIAPTGTPTLVIPLVFALAGSATWLAYLVAMVGILFVAAAVNVFAKRSASPGSLYTYAAIGLGPGWGVVTGWALFIAYAGTGAAVTTGFANYANVLVGRINASWHIPSAILISLSVLVSWWVAHRDIKLSTRLILWLEFGSVSLILLLVGATLIQNGIDWPQLTLEGSSVGALRNGLVLATFSYVGFESATVLGSEASNPLRNIPRAVLLSATLIGILFVLASYSETLAFHGEVTSLDKSGAPLHVVADKAGLGFLGWFIDIGAVVCFFACVLASINAAARVLFFLAHHRVFHKSLTGTHHKNETPHIAVGLTAILTWLPAFILAARGAGDFDIYGWVGTVATVSFILVYIAVLVSAPLYLARRRELKPFHVLSAVAGTAFLVNAIAGNLYPVPAAPYNWLPYLAFALVGAGGGWYLVRRIWVPDLAKGIGQSLRDIHESFKTEAEA
jgi:amino acid transporter